MRRLSKDELRRNAIRTRGSLTFEELDSMSRTVQKNLLTLNEFRDSKVIASYVAKRDEVQTERIIRDALKEGKRVLVPMTDSANGRLIFSELSNYDSDLAPGTFGILEPKVGHLRPRPLEDADVVLVPLATWDERGFRIGYGKGYFDAALAPLRGTLSIGLALESQRVERIPEERHDVPLRIIVTEKRIVRPAWDQR